MVATPAEIGTADTSVKNNRHNLRSHRNGSLALKSLNAELQVKEMSTMTPGCGMIT